MQLIILYKNVFIIVSSMLLMLTTMMFTRVSFGGYFKSYELVISMVLELVYLLYMIPTLYGTPYSFDTFLVRVFLEMRQFYFQVINTGSDMNYYQIRTNIQRSLEDLSPSSFKHRVDLLKQHSKMIKSYESRITRDLESKRPNSYQKWISYNYLSWLITLYCKLMENHFIIPPIFYYHPSIYALNPYFGSLESLKYTFMYNQYLKTYSQFKNFIIKVKAVEPYIDNIIKKIKENVTLSLFPPQRVMKRIMLDIVELMEWKTEELIHHPITLKFQANLDSCKEITPKQSKYLVDQLLSAIKLYFIPSIQRLYAYFISISIFSKPEIGIWSQPRGAERYRLLIYFYSSSSMHPMEIIERGMVELEKIKSKIIELVQPEYVFDECKESFGDFIGNILEEERFQFRGDNRKEDTIKYLRSVWEDFKERIEEVLGVTQQYKNLTIIPKQFKGPIPYIYFPASSRRNTAQLWYNTIHPLAYNRIIKKAQAFKIGIPGKHLQSNLTISHPSFDIIRKSVVNYSSSESWGTYASSLGLKYGWYNDKWEELGFHILNLRTTARMVTDCSIHYDGIKWDFDQASLFLSKFGYREAEATKTIDYITALPALSVASKMGYIKLKDLRKYCKQQLGDRFDIKHFHSIILNAGQVPIDILFQVIQYWISEKLSNINSGIQ